MRSITPQVRRIGDEKYTVGETPVWNVAEQALWWVNCEDEPALLRWDPETNAIRRWDMPERIGGFVFTVGGGVLVALASGLFDFDVASGKLSKRVASPLPASVSLHECACDPTGRFWIGGFDHALGPDNPFPGGSKLFRLEGDRLVAEIDSMTCTNGLAFSPDGSILYVTDSTTRRCDRYPLDPATGRLGPRETFFELGEQPGFVDGAAVDSEGAYWCPLVYAAKLRRYLPDGTVDLEVNLPFDNPTKVAFGGADMRTIFVTSTANSLTGPSPNPLDGGVFAFETEFTGRPDPLFKG